MKHTYNFISISSLVFAYVLKLLILFFMSAAVYASDCARETVARLESVAKVIDADTLALKSGQRVRLIGIDAPELGYAGQADEPFAREGMLALQQRLRASGNQVWVQAGEDSHDRYGRLLADVFFKDGSSVQAWLLQQGWVMQVFVSPNLAYADCLKAYEQRAKQARSGIWSLADYYPGIDSRAVPADAKGAVILTGRVVRIGNSRANIWLNLEGGVAIQIPRWSSDTFAVSLQELQGRQVQVRGWIVKESSPHHQWRIRIDDGRALETLD